MSGESHAFEHYRKCVLCKDLFEMSEMKEVWKRKGRDYEKVFYCMNCFYHGIPERFRETLKERYSSIQKRLKDAEERYESLQNVNYLENEGKEFKLHFKVQKLHKRDKIKLAQRFFREDLEELIEGISLKFEEEGLKAKEIRRLVKRALREKAREIS